MSSGILDDATNPVVEQAALEDLVGTSLEPAAARSMFELWRRFAANHPRDEPHAYLSLLVTHPDHRGQGIGQRLLAEDLARFDADGVPAYLESTNPGNDHRYERAGFERIGGFQAVLDDARSRRCGVHRRDPAVARLTSGWASVRCTELNRAVLRDHLDQYGREAADQQGA